MIGFAPLAAVPLAGGAVGAITVPDVIGTLAAVETSDTMLFGGEAITTLVVTCRGIVGIIELPPPADETGEAVVSVRSH